MKLLSFLNLAVASVVLCLTTAGCSSGKFASTSVKHPKVSEVKKKPVSPQDSNGEPPITDDTNTGKGDISTSLIKKCGSSTEEMVLNIRLDFPSTKGVECRWGLGGNLSRATGNGQARAVLGQAKRFSMPKNSALCSIAFNGGTTVVDYDDFLHFTFDDFVLASAQFTESDFLNMGMEKSGDLIKYDPVKHIGKGPYNEDMNNRTNAICPKTGSCSMVQSQKSGSLAINAPKTWFDLLPAATLLNSEHDVTVWVTGQTQSTDCQHTGMGFDLIIKYVQ